MTGRATCQRAFMKTITTTADLAQFCEEAARHDYVTVDTEFLRERTYYSKLCLVQLAMPGTDDSNAVLVDPLADGIKSRGSNTVLANSNRAPHDGQHESRDSHWAAPSA